MTDRPAIVPLSCDQVRDLAPGFVLGALEPAEMSAVRDHLGTCPEAHAEFAELGGVIPYLAESLEPVPPPAALRGRVLAAVAAEAAARTTASGPAAVVPAAVPTTRPAPAAAPVVSLGVERARRRSPLWWIAAVAAVLVIAGLGTWNVSLRHDLDGAEAYGAAVDRVLAVAGTPGGQAAILAPAQPGGPAGIAAIGADGAVEIAVRGLAPTTGPQVYQAWVIGPDKTPVAIGSFVPDGRGFGTLATAGAPSSPGVTIALTREPTAGRTSPTPPVLSSGVATGSS
jgi:anti-sigma factor RsiW